MAQEYKVTAVSPKTKEWSSQYGDMITYYVKVDTEADAVQVNKKAGGNAPQVGDELYGTITSTEYGLKFKGEKKPFSPGGKSNYQPRDDESIKAQFAIKTAARMAPSFVEKTGDLESWIEIEAKKLFAMVDRVKSSEPKSGYDTFKQAGEAVKAKQEQPVSNEEVDSLINSGEEISLADIPF